MAVSQKSVWRRVDSWILQRTHCKIHSDPSLNVGAIQPSHWKISGSPAWRKFPVSFWDSAPGLFFCSFLLWLATFDGAGGGCPLSPKLLRSSAPAPKQPCIEGFVCVHSQFKSFNFLKPLKLFVLWNSASEFESLSRQSASCFLLNPSPQNVLKIMQRNQVVS